MNNEAVKNITGADFAATVGQGTVIVDFWAPWCGPCRSQLAILDDMVTQGRLPEGMVIAKVNVDEEPDLAAQFTVQTIPTLLVFKNGEQVKRFTGVQSAARLLAAAE